MRVNTILIFGAALLILILTKCNSSDTSQKDITLKQKEIELKEREMSIQQQENNANQIKKHEQEVIEQTQDKYMYVVIKTDEPRIESEKIELPPDPVMKRESSLSDGLTPGVVEAHFLPEPRYHKYSVSQYYFYTSEVVKISNYSEDNRYMEVDRYQKQINQSITEANRKIQFENSYQPGGYINAEAKIISKDSYVFDSYKEASMHRDANKQ